MAKSVAQPDLAWTDAWSLAVASIGTYVDGDELIEGAETVEEGLIRRFCEPVELDCPLHADAAMAAAHGYDGIVAPYSSYLAFATAPLWSPGDAPVFTDAAPNAHPDGAPVRVPYVGDRPPYSAYFATDFDIDFFAPVVVGDRLSRRGNRLVGCEPKETRVGRGAFTTWERAYENQRGEIVASLRVTLYLYDPFDGEPA